MEVGQSASPGDSLGLQAVRPRDCRCGANGCGEREARCCPTGDTCAFRIYPRDCATTAARCRYRSGVSDCFVPSRGPDPLEERLIGALPRLRAHLASKRGRVSGCELDDVAQEVITRALRYRESFDATRALWPWLRRMADLVLLDQHSAEARRPALSDELDPTAPEETVTLDARDEVERLLAQLPAREREVLVRFHQLEQSVRMIAEAMRLPQGTVKSHLSRARRRLACPGDKLASPSDKEGKA